MSRASHQIVIYDNIDNYLMGDLRPMEGSGLVKKCLLYSACALSAVTTPAFAQENSSEEAEDSVDIVVTANRVESLASKTPIALTAISGDDLIRSGITNPTQLQESVPNLVIHRGTGLQITIRGVTSSDGTEKGDPSAAFLLDGIYIARPQVQEVSFFDIQRVEVLRGPQGTLYGRNTTAGVVNVIANRPTRDVGGRIDLSYGNYDKINATGVINLPVSDTLAFRAAVNHDSRDNFVLDGADDGVNFGGTFKDNTSVRLSALWEPSQDFSLYVMGDYSSVGGRVLGEVPIGNFFTNIVPLATADPNGSAPTVPTYVSGSSANQYQTNPNPLIVDPRGEIETMGIMAEASYGSGPFNVTYLASYREFERDEVNALNAGSLASNFTGENWQTSHELRLAYANGPLQAQVGGYYFKENSGIAFFLEDFFFPGSQFGFPQDPTIAVNRSVFGQISYEIVEDVRLTGGIRYSNDQKSRQGRTVLQIFGPDGSVAVENVFAINDADRTFDKVTWRAGIDYDSEIGLIFASVSSGYKAGGFNDGCEAGTDPACVLPAEALYYDPETLTAYEAGFKFRFDNGIRLDGTVFHYDYKGLQLSGLGDCGGPCLLTSNAAAAKVDGVELQAFAELADGLTLDLGANWLNARFGEYFPNPTGFPNLNFEGRALSRSPEWTLSAGINYVHSLNNGGEIVVDARTRYSSSYALTDTTDYIGFEQPSYTRTDIALTYNAPDNAYYVSLFVENLEDEIVLTSASFGFGGSAVFADPRLYGIRAGVAF